MSEAPDTAVPDDAAAEAAPPFDASKIPGATIDPADPTTRLRPMQVTMMQAQLALFSVPSPVHAGKTLLDDVEATVAASTDPRVRIAWARAAVIERRGLFLGLIAPTIPGLDTDEALDALFAAAAQITV